MGFMDKAKASFDQLQAKADAAMSNAGISGPVGGGDADRYFQDLGMLAYLEWTGRGGNEADRARVFAALQNLEQQGAIRSFALRTAAPPPPGAAAAGYPPPPGAAGAAAPPPPPGAAASAAAPPAPPTYSDPTAPPMDPPPPAAPPAAAPPPPPPSWAKPAE